MDVVRGRKKRSSLAGQLSASMSIRAARRFRLESSGRDPNDACGDVYEVRGLRLWAFVPERRRLFDGSLNVKVRFDIGIAQTISNARV